MALELNSTTGDSAEFCDPSSNAGLECLSKGGQFMLSFYIGEMTQLRIENYLNDNDIVNIGVDQSGHPFYLFQDEPESFCIIKSSGKVDAFSHVLFKKREISNHSTSFLEIYINGVKQETVNTIKKHAKYSFRNTSFKISGHGVMKDLELFSDVSIPINEIYRKPSEILLRADQLNCELCYLFCEGNYASGSYVFDYSKYNRNARFGTMGAGNYIVDGDLEVGYIVGNNNFNKYQVGTIGSKSIFDNSAPSFKVQFYYSETQYPFHILQLDDTPVISIGNEKLRINCGSEKLDKEINLRKDGLNEIELINEDCAFVKFNTLFFKIPNLHLRFNKFLIGPPYDSTFSFVIEIKQDDQLLYDGQVNNIFGSIEKHPFSTRVLGPYQLDLFKKPFKSERYQPSGNRIALIIANTLYPVDPLNNPSNDADLMQNVLQDCGFDVKVEKDLTKNEMTKVITEVLKNLKNDDQTTFMFYYAGHGADHNGTNYLIPIDGEGESLQDKCIDLSGVLDSLKQFALKNFIVVIDACRKSDSPYYSSGFSIMNAPIGSLISYSTSPGFSALDGEPGMNGLFTEILAKNIKIPSLSVEELFKRVRKEVYKKSGEEQLPWESSSLIEDFYFH
jgi:hypothetical protein